MAENKSTGPDSAKRAAASKAAKPSKAKTPEKAEPRGPSVWMAQASQFLREVKTELKKVNWPSRRQTVSSTAVVLALVILVSAFLGLVDLVLVRIVRLVIG